jgi:hypothetical protein
LHMTLVSRQTIGMTACGSLFGPVAPQAQPQTKGHTAIWAASQAASHTARQCY